MQGDVLRLTMPAAPRFSRIARVGVTGLASRLGFSYEDVQDLRQAIGEACGHLVDQSEPGSSLEVRYLVDEHAMEVEVEVDELVAGRSDQVTDLARKILEATVDDHQVRDEGRTVWFRKSMSDD